MTSPFQTSPFQTSTLLNDLDRVAQIRDRMAYHLEAIAQTLTQAEQEGTAASGSMQLQRDIEDLRKASTNLKQGVFRLLVLGDMKRGKSTFLNALLGENLLPSDVNPCTALLTILRYGTEKKVTVYFIDDQAPLVLDFADFKTRYTIDPAEAKLLSQRREPAFAEVSHAIVEYPLPLLEKGIEIVDSPGLNDTEARNALSLGFIGNCHGILFVMRASQPCTLAERRYLENYIQNRGLSVFFLINAWDQVQESLIDPEDREELQGAETRLRQVFKSNLAAYCQGEGYDFYAERVFELSALQALRRRIQDADADLEGTGFPAFLAALNTFLTQERAIAELRQVRTLGRQVAHRVQTAIARRLPLLHQSVAELSQRIAAVQPQFNRLLKIRDEVRQEIQNTRDEQARAIAHSFQHYLLHLEQRFEQDFSRYQPPELGLLDTLSPDKQEAFRQALEKAFQQYLKDQVYAWGITAEQDLKETFAQLGRKAEVYGLSYQEITDQIHATLTGEDLKAQPHFSGDEGSIPTWAQWAMGLFSWATGNPTAVDVATVGFDLTRLGANLLTAATIGWVVSSIFGVVLGPIAFALVGLGLGALQAQDARDKINQTLKAALIQQLPQVAEDQRQAIATAVRDCFDQYEREVISRIDDDIQARQTELDHLLQQKQSREIDQQQEQARFNHLEDQITLACEGIEVAYQALLA